MSKLALITCVFSCLLTLGLITNNVNVQSTTNCEQFACKCHEKNNDKNKSSSNLAGCPCKDKTKSKDKEKVKKPVNDCRDCGIA